MRMACRHMGRACQRRTLWGGEELRRLSTEQRSAERSVVPAAGPRRHSRVYFHRHLSAKQIRLRLSSGSYGRIYLEDSDITMETRLSAHGGTGRLRLPLTI